MILKCPGAQKLRDVMPDYIKCPDCDEELEIWTDELQVSCPKCKKEITREDNKSCVDWCNFAKKCVGNEKYNKYMKNKGITLKNKLIDFLEEYFGNDIKRINHAKKVLSYAEQLLKSEKGDWHIVIPTSILHDVGIKIAEEKYGSSAGTYQEIEGPPIARGILLKLGFKIKDIDEICEIIAHHHTPGKISANNFKILYDADWLVNIKDEVGIENKDKVRRVIEKVFLTKTGKEVAKSIYL